MKTLKRSDLIDAKNMAQQALEQLDAAIESLSKVESSMNRVMDDAGWPDTRLGKDMTILLEALEDVVLDHHAKYGYVPLLRKLVGAKPPKPRSADAQRAAYDLADELMGHNVDVGLDPLEPGEQGTWDLDEEDLRSWADVEFSDLATGTYRVDLWDAKYDVFLDMDSKTCSITRVS